MIEQVNDSKYDTRIYASDWRYGAAIVGMKQFFDKFQIDYKFDDSCMEYNQNDIKSENAINQYFQYAKEYFSIDEDGEELKSKFLYGRYSKFCNKSCFYKDDSKICRLVGYYVDLNRKKKSTSWNFDDRTYVYQDCFEFNFIPFAFTNTIDAFFVNANFSLVDLCAINEKLHDCIHNYSDDPRKFLFGTESELFIDYDVEILHIKSKEPYRTIYMRKEAIDIFKQISSKQFEVLCYACLRKDKSYYNVLANVSDRILNLIKLDDIIENFIKYDSDKVLLINTLIEINEMIYEYIFK